MKRTKLSVFLIMFVLIFTIVMTGCDNTTIQNVVDFQDNQIIEVSKTLEGNHFDILQKLSDDLLKKDELNTILPSEVYQKVILEGDLSYFVVDIRSSQDFAAGHIDGAVNIPYNLTANERLIANLPNDKEIVVVCYSGHTAGQTALLWKMLGYNATPMLDGMGGWKEGAGTAIPTHAYDFPVEVAIQEATNFQTPTIAVAEAVNVNSLILNRSQSYLSSGKGPVINAPTLNEIIFESKDSNYFLVDIRQTVDYEQGHIQGAINIPAMSIAELDSLKKLPTDKKLVVIGYTGADASGIVRVLNQLGYDSYALLQGMRVWTSSEEINGIAPVSNEVINNQPLEKLNYNIEGGGDGSAACG